MTYEELLAQLLDYFQQNDEDFTVSIEELDNYNNYLDRARIEPMDALDDYTEGLSVKDIMEAALRGSDAYGDEYFNPQRDYFYRSDYNGHFISTNDKDYSYWLDNDFVDSLARCWLHRKLRGVFTMFLPEAVADA